MNLTRLREFRFERLVYEMYEKYKGRLYGGPDQDILNIIFSTYKGHALSSTVNCLMTHAGVLKGSSDSFTQITPPSWIATTPSTLHTVEIGMVGSKIASGTQRGKGLSVSAGPPSSME